MRLWDSKKREPITTFTGVQGYALSVACSSTREMVAIGSYYNEVRIGKAVYPFSCFTEEKKERLFKQFKVLYRILEKMPTTGDDVVMS